jgi:hypothetical protein
METDLVEQGSDKSDFHKKKTHPDSIKRFTETDIIKMLDLLIDNIIAIFIAMFIAMFDVVCFI